ncbi:hypothetical protein PRIPAC_76124 [Pristionchus pacificus]|nr:hypothetical protein PRIPAC_76124 [Pristionchus pacificus]
MDITFRDLNGLKHDMNVLLSSLEELAVTEENQQEIIALIEEMQKEDKDIAKRVDAYQLMSYGGVKLGNSPNENEKLVVEQMEKLHREGDLKDRLDKLKEKFENGPREEDEDEMEVVSASYSKKDPITKEDITDPVRNSKCGHVYDRESVKEFIDMHKRNKQACYQCPVQGCNNKVNLALNDLIDFPEFFQLCK